MRGREISLIVTLCSRFLWSLWCQRLTYSGFSEINLEPPRQLCRRAFKWRDRWWTLPALLRSNSSPPTCWEPRASRMCSHASGPCSLFSPEVTFELTEFKRVRKRTWSADSMSQKNINSVRERKKSQPVVLKKLFTFVLGGEALTIWLCKTKLILNVASPVNLL